MYKDRKEYCQKNVKLKRALKDWEVDEKIKVNPRKWNAKKLEQALRAVARYELKIFDARVSQELQKIKKGAGPKDEIKCLGEIEKHYRKAGKYIKEKIDGAIEEIEEDKADDLKAIKDGKTALGKVDDLDAIGVFKVATAAAGKEIDDLTKRYNDEMKAKRAAGGSDDWDDDKLKQQIQSAESDLTKIRERFDNQTSIGIKAIEYLNKTAEKIAKNKDVRPEVKNFSDDVKSIDKTTFQPWVKEVEKYSAGYTEALKILSARTISTPTLAKMKKMLATASAGASAGGAVDKQLKELAKRLKTLEKDLK
jgi:hypothetical protein